MAAIDDATDPLKAAPVASSPSPRLANGQSAQTPQRRRSSVAPVRQRSLLGRLFSTVTRLFTWYAILTILFRCPASLDDCNASSPQICRPYFVARATVFPYLEPVYDAYAAPYVNVVRPYYDAVDRAVVAPARHFAEQTAAPQIAHLQTLARTHWDASVEPQLAAAQAAAAAKYAEHLAPSVDRATAAVMPYALRARDVADRAYHEAALPALRFVSPYAARGYAVTATFATETAAPTIVWTWRHVSDFLDDAVWPRLQVLYLDTVEPQLAKIGQRLGRSGDSVAKLVKSSTTVSTQSATSSTATEVSLTSTTSSTTIYSTVSSTAATTASSSAAASITAPAKLQSRDAVQPPDEPDDTETDERRLARETVTEDLRAWQEKYAKAADEGAAEMEQRVEEIATRMIRQSVRKTGRRLVDDLEQAVVVELRQLRQDVRDIVARMQAEEESKTEVEEAAETDEVAESAESSEVEETNESDEAESSAEVKPTRQAKKPETAEERAARVASAATKAAAKAEADKLASEEILASVRRAGVAIKQRAQKVREWREEFGHELEDTVNRAAENHFTILASIRDLALQKIGMKWAWMEGVTYRDWAKYHQLKSRFDEWEADLEQLIVEHPAIALAQATAQRVEDEAMRTAQSAALELARLKQVAGWKLTARDASDVFDSESMQAAAEAKLQAEVAAVEEEVEELVEDEIAESAETETTETTETIETVETAATIPPSGPIDTTDIIYDTMSDMSATASHEAEATESVAVEVEDKEEAADEAADAVADETASEEPADESSSTADASTDSAASTPSHVADEL